MDKIPTAEEFLNGYIDDFYEISTENIPNAMIEFTKLHVKAALDKRDLLYQTYYKEEINWTEDNKNFILNSYP